MKRILWCLPVLALSVAAVAIEPAAPERVTAAFSDPSRPGLLKVNLINGGIHVKGYSGKEVVVEARTRSGEPEHAPPEGMRRIPMTSSGLELQEENNIMTVGVGVPSRTVDLDIQVPAHTSLKLKTINGGEITVEGVQGEIEASDINGAVILTNISGSAVAHALNGKVTASFAQVDPQKPMSFSSLNGDIDVTFPPTLKANVKLKSDRGEVFSDFDIVTRAPAAPVVQESRSEKGKYRVHIDRAVYGTINGGGPEIQFSNFNGSIYIRKAK
jgi:hypothetical protein